jgi:hypothetical protein
LLQDTGLGNVIEAAAPPKFRVNAWIEKTVVATGATFSPLTEGVVTYFSSNEK